MNATFKTLKAALGMTFLTLLALNATAQTGAMSISENPHTPHQSAMLDMVSNDKGLLIPRMSFNEMNNISPVKDGLMVFVTNNDDKHGYWYWDSNAPLGTPNPPGDWVHLEIDNGSTSSAVSPEGAIIMYSGPIFGLFDGSGMGQVGTAMEGWAVCNGQNNTPDLRGRFVVGGNQALGTAPYNYTQLGNTGGQDSIALTINQMPRHRHDVDASKTNAIMAPHTHDIVELPHHHRIRTTAKGTGSDTYLRRRDPNAPASISTTHEQADISIDMFNGTIDFDFPPDYLKQAGGDPNSGATRAIENRPPYYVMAFIMRTNGAFNPGLPVNYTY